MPNSVDGIGGRLPASFYARAPVDVAVNLLSCRLFTCKDGELTGGRIAEAEAYGAAWDPASHAGKYRTGREIMAGPVARAYVFRSYGVHTMLNPVAHAPGESGAVLIRAIEPEFGVPAMRERRGLTDSKLLCRGPGRLCQALAIRLEDFGLDLSTSASIWIAPGEPVGSVLCGPRIGISAGQEWPWRFFVADNPFVSATRVGSPVTELAAIKHVVPR